MKFDDIQLAWAAGLFEGEGNIRINKPTKRNLGHLCVSVTNCDRRILDYFQERWPGYMKPTTKMRDYHSDAWSWVIAANRAAEFLKVMLPYFLTERTWTRAMLGLEFQGQKSRFSQFSRADEYRARQWEFYWAMRAWNHHPRRTDCPNAAQHRKKDDGKPE